MDTVELKDLGDGRFEIHGKLTFETVASALEQSKKLFAGFDRMTVDMAEVVDADSAGLALLLEWITWANHTVREIRFEGMPEKINAIARTTEVESLLSRGERWVGFIDAPAE